jgi:hypothetical protein
MSRSQFTRCQIRQIAPSLPIPKFATLRRAFLANFGIEKTLFEVLIRVCRRMIGTSNPPHWGTTNNDTHRPLHSRRRHGPNIRWRRYLGRENNEMFESLNACGRWRLCQMSVSAPSRETESLKRNNDSSSADLLCDPAVR